MAGNVDCIFNGSFLQEVLDSNFDSSGYSVDDYVAKRNQLYSDIYNIYHNQEGGKEVIENLMEAMLVDGIQNDKNKSKFDLFKDNFKKYNNFFTKMSSIISLDINTFNYYLYDYFNIDGKGNGTSAFMPLIQQEEAIFDQVAMITSNSSEFFSSIYDRIADKIVNDENDSRKSSYKLDRSKSFRNVIRLNAAAGTGKTTLVAGTTLKIAEQILGDPKHNKIIATASNSSMAKDLYSELKNGVKANLTDKNLSIDDIVALIKANDFSFLDNIKTFVIDEASLLQAGISVNTGEFSDSEYLFNMIHEAIERTGKDIKIILLGDSKQLSYYKPFNDDKAIGKGLSTTDKENIPTNSNPLEIVGVMESSELTDSFRTSSVLLQNVFNQLRHPASNGEGFVMDGHPLRGKYARSKDGDKRMLGYRNTEGSTKGKEAKDITVKSYVDDFVLALKEIVGTEEAYSVLDSIKTQVENQKGGTFDIMYAANLGIDKKDFLNILYESSPEGKIFVDLVRDSDNHLNFKYYGNEITDAQGQEADYVFINLKDDDMGSMINEKGHTLNASSSSYRNGLAIVYMLATRSRLYTHTINNNSDLKFQSEFTKDLYNVLSENDIIEKADIARKVYTDVYNAQKENFHDRDGKQSVINWKKVKEVEPVTSEEKKIREESNKINNAKIDYNNQDESNRSFEPLESVISGYDNLSDKDINDKIELIIVDIKNEKDRKKWSFLVEELRLLEQVLDIRNFLNKNKIYIEDDNYQLILDDIRTQEIIKEQEKKDSYINTYERAIDNLDKNSETYNEDKAKLLDKISKRKAELVAKVMESFGYAYAYPEFNKDRDGDKVIDEKELLETLGYNKTDITIASKDVKRRALGIAGTNSKYNYDIVVKRINGKYHTYVIGRKKGQLGLGKAQLLLHTFSERWEGKASTSFFNKVNTIMDSTGKDVYVIKNIKNEEFKGIISHITPGPIIKGNKNITLREWITKNTVDNTITFNDNKNIRLGKKIFTYIGENPALRGKQFIVYSQSENINLESENFKAWATMSLGDNETGHFKGLYTDANSNKHKVGMIMLDNKRYSISEIYKKLNVEDFSKIDEDKVFTLMSSYLSMSNMVSFFANTYLSLGSDALNKNTVLQEKLKSIAELNNDNHKLFGSDEAEAKNRQEEFIKLVDSLDDSKKDILRNLLDDIFDVNSRDPLTYGEFTGGVTKTKNGNVVNKKKGKIFTLLGSTTVGDEEFRNSYSVKLEKILTSIRVKEVNTEGYAEEVLNTIDYLLDNTKYFKGGLKTQFVSANTSSELTSSYIVDNVYGEGLFGNRVDELTLNVSGIGEASIVLDLKALDNTLNEKKMQDVAKALNKLDEAEGTTQDVHTEEKADVKEESKENVSNVEAKTKYGLKSSEELLDDDFMEMFEENKDDIEDADIKLKRLTELIDKNTAEVSDGKTKKLSDISDADLIEITKLHELLSTSFESNKSDNDILNSIKINNKSEIIRACK